MQPGQPYNRRRSNAGIAAIAALTGVFSLAAAGAEAKSWRIGVIVYDGVLTSDITGPLEVFGAASRKAWFEDYTVETISADADTEIVTEEGLRLTADHLIGGAGDFDIVIVPSSYSMNKILANEALIEFVRKQSKTAKWMGSNCSGAQVLAAAGVLDGRKATTWAGGERAFARRYPQVDVQYDVNVVVDGNAITSNGGLVSYEAALTLLEKIKGKKFADEISVQLQLPRLAHAFSPVSDNAQ